MNYINLTERKIKNKDFKHFPVFALNDSRERLMSK